MPLLKSKKMIFKVLYSLKPSGAGAGAGAAIWICGSLEPEPKEIFSAPQYWRKLSSITQSDGLEISLIDSSLEDADLSDLDLSEGEPASPGPPTASTTAHTLQLNPACVLATSEDAEVAAALAAATSSEVRATVTVTATASTTAPNQPPAPPEPLLGQVRCFKCNLRNHSRDYNWCYFCNVKYG